MDKTELRRVLRQKRQKLSSAEQSRAATDLAEVICSLPVFQNSQHIALYIANDGEINPQACAEAAWQSGKQCYLPVLDPVDQQKMVFLPYEADSKLVNNRFGIPEPEFSAEALFPAEQLDLVLMPLTGFDEAGHRLGMGGGFYDRAFAFVRDGGSTVLIGLAHECQKVEGIPVESWDIAMSGVATDGRFYSG